MTEKDYERILSPTERRIEDTYILGDIVAKGQFSHIVKCLHKGKIVRACRVYKKESVRKDKFQNHYKTILTLNHPHIIHIYEMFETANELFLICDMITGGELFERILEFGHYSEKEAAKAMKCILSALECLHRNDIVHGDIRPESLLYQSERPDAPLKLRDVSFSKKPHDSYASVYLAPERNKHMGDTKEEDIWSLGIVLYIMLCGLEPEECGKSLCVCGSQLPWFDDISESAKNLIKQMLEELPEKRITPCEALENSWVKGHSTKENHLHATVERLKEFTARNKFRAATKAVLATQRMVLPQKKVEPR